MGKKGLFYFCQGMLYDAVCREKTGEEAAIEMMMWERVKIQFKRLPEKKIIRRIQTEVMPLLLEASRRKDENQSEAEMDEAHIEVVEPVSISENAGALSPIEEPLRSLSDIDPDARSNPGSETLKPHILQRCETAIEELASEIKATAYTGIFDRDGIALTEIAATSHDWHAFSARMAEMLHDAIAAVQETGSSALRQIILETETHWLICRPFEPSLCLVSVSGKKSPLGAIRLAVSRCIEQITSDSSPAS
jgi:predicted regulator of Ras-like GTPase activity (Roadblock/LC7/MglB family)